MLQPLLGCRVGLSLLTASSGSQQQQQASMPKMDKKDSALVLQYGAQILVDTSSYEHISQKM